MICRRARPNGRWTAEASSRYRTPSAFAAALAIWSSCASWASGATLSATPSDLDRVFKATKSGDVLVLQAGRYGAVVLSGRRFAKALVIDASAATIQGLVVRNMDGLEIRGGDFRVPPVVDPKPGKPVFGTALRLASVKNVTLSGISVTGPGAPPGAKSGPYGAGFGVLLRNSEDIEVRNSRFQGLRTGITVDTSSRFRLVGNTFKAQSADGIDVSASRHGLIEGNTCSDTRISPGAHADCIQLWSRPAAPPTSDVVIRRNRVEGNTQGIFLGNHVRNGVDDGGFDRITIEDNDVNVLYANAISLMAGRASIVRNNRIQTSPGSKYWATIRSQGDVKRCGNSVAAAAKKARVDEPPCS